MQWKCLPTSTGVLSLFNGSRWEGFINLKKSFYYPHCSFVVAIVAKIYFFIRNIFQLYILTVRRMWLMSQRKILFYKLFATFHSLFHCTHSMEEFILISVNVTVKFNPFKGLKSAVSSVLFSFLLFSKLSVSPWNHY